MVARRNWANCDYRWAKRGGYIPIWAACYIAKGRSHENKAYRGPVNRWRILGGVRRGSDPLRGHGDRQAGRILQLAYRVLEKSVARGGKKSAARGGSKKYRCGAHNGGCGEA